MDNEETVEYIDEEPVKRSQGQVIWFNSQRGYGFIRDDELGSDLFVHYSKIDAPIGEFRMLNSGDIVEYEKFVVERGSKNKQQAKDVKIIKRMGWDKKELSEGGEPTSTEENKNEE